MRLNGTGPLASGAALHRLFEPLNDAAGLVIAVSGGPDSVALMHLLAQWVRSAPLGNILVATVDHGLRPESAGEVALVAQAASGLGFPHRTLRWVGEKPVTGIQEAAREARYGLLVASAREVGASHLVTAHTLEDQAETVLMRISRGSGVAGLAGMRAVTDRNGIRHARPLLGVSKAELVSLCEANGWRYVQDPSNADHRFARARWRKLMPLLAAEGITSERLARLAERAARVEDALDAKARDAISRATTSEVGDPLRLRAGFLVEEPFEIAVRALALALVRFRERTAQVRLDRLEAGVERLSSALRERRALRLTVGGALLSLGETGELTVGSEPVRRRGAVASARGAAASPHSLGKGGEHA